MVKSWQSAKAHINMHHVEPLTLGSEQFGTSTPWHLLAGFDPVSSSTISGYSNTYQTK